MQARLYVVEEIILFSDKAKNKTKKGNNLIRLLMGLGDRKGIRSEEEGLDLV